MLAVLILKLRYKYKAKLKGYEDSELCFVKKTTCLEFHNECNELYIIPTISISFNCGVSISIYLLNLYYSSFWTVVTYEDEDEYAEFIRYKNKNK